ncbi:asparagine synthase (glutamine-hydrolyzing) [Priestia megaterium]|jgi:asparagine synthase (glutamine-hydrolysing)|uniref:asparagine synthase (glutamine-hydrolyzing) n=1 Tax=Priestia megaterium TaxID=1404 RepID=A0A6H1P0Y6_PRIMG|nr:asparagine synthase (glutamine-hydrolyzing) [Priestia megaterium]QIZ07087.1 asparagine synthase (glutamine-hydrolyzing) [Priestia megaterium]
MCGITGWINFDKSLKNEAGTLTKMTNTLAKRGPDETNIWSETHVAFGHKRLIVVDPEGGRQPMSKQKDGFDYTICYNGELYNTEDIRKVLHTKGYSFKGHSDTEVLLSAYIEWAEECVNYLNGIYAFAIWDRKKEQLFIGRDRLGVKPLFFREHKKGLLFASETKAILAHPEVKTEIDQEGLAEIFGIGPSRSPGSGVFKGIKELRPAHALTFSKNGLKIWRYWNVKSGEHKDNVEETAEKVRYLVTDAVTRQLVSDVPLSTFLSGGLDSSIITAIAAKGFKDQNKGQLHTYSIDYEGNDKFFSSNEFQPDADGKFIQMITDKFNTKHHNKIITQKQLVNDLVEATHVRDLPGMADVDSSLLWFCKEIKQDFVVSLSGECADEIFGGYPWFHRKQDLERPGFPWMRSVSERQNLLKSHWQEKLKLNDYVMEKYNQAVAETPRLEGESGEDAKRRELFYINMINFMTTLLDRKDRMSMGASLEVRVPFADHRLVEYVWNIPWEMKMYRGREKGILRKAFEGILPEEVLYRKKSPYPKTHNPAYTIAVQKLVENILQDKSSALHEFFNKEQLESIVKSGGNSFQEPWFGQLMTGPQLLAYLVQLHTWFKDYNINIVN